MSREEHRFEREEISNLIFEGEESVKEIGFAVLHAKLSTAFAPTFHNVYINLTTKEKENYFVELSALGFRIVGRSFDTITEDSKKYYETIYALLDDISPLYRLSFGEALSAKLMNLQNMVERNS